MLTEYLPHGRQVRFGFKMSNLLTIGRADFGRLRAVSWCTIQMYITIDFLLTHHSLTIALHQLLMESTGDNPTFNVQAMDRALEEGLPIEREEAQEVEELSRSEERRRTYSGQDPTYNHLIRAMGLNHQMIKDYYDHMHDEMLRAYPSPYAGPQTEAEEVVEVVTPGEREDLEWAIEMP